MKRLGPHCLACCFQYLDVVVKCSSSKQWELLFEIILADFCSFKLAIYVMISQIEARLAMINCEVKRCQLVLLSSNIDFFQGYCLALSVGAQILNARHVDQ